MNNWTALGECEDARDADQLQRRKQEAARSVQANSSLLHLNASAMNGGMDDLDSDLLVEGGSGRRHRESAETISFASALSRSGWFDTRPENEQGRTETSTPSTAPAFTSQQKRQWTKEQDTLLAKAKADSAAPRAATGVLAEQLGFDDAIPVSDMETDAGFDVALPAPPTERRIYRDKPPHELIRALIQERHLTPSQALAFSITARKFFEELYGHSTQPLRLLMHGEAGTGKTVVVRLLRELLERYGRGKDIKFMAPTGKAASSIGGTTQHCGFGLEVHQRSLTTQELNQSQVPNVARRMRYLQETFEHIRWVFFDEVSMTSCEMLCDIDQALRIGTQNLNEPFGGVNVIFAGDLCQLPPVASFPLYTTVSTHRASAEVRTKVELGRAI
ncbi:unnamed protein product [Tilletia controversa]|uniref:ATP-dependent DNA helicase n=1 Tax=Tilletia controversa TaxID=13291 RepID=A0A8X7MQB2_9BASI|nr:hypothetical protein CF335_g4883 [Tilletia laevis]KAE8202408.1 hypothetical protein CF328_g2233 [Tilletia controversa]KAE8243641.1 hypothetical protein A4X06_0g6175 [Tilletia controversa]CAD6932482.1 unnamed protein product [Tilletia controversa]CAD6933705.1 unnamed protein product [Tilletia controversa]